MTDTIPAAAADSPPTTTEAPAVAKEKKKEEGNFFLFLLKLVVIVLVFRICIFAPFNIPSESMLPRLLDGDYLLASKWSYGFSNYSLPFGLRPFPRGRIFARQPERGDIVIFKAPPLEDEDYIKRVIGLPGDQVQMKGGVLWLNGAPVKKTRLADFEIAVSPNTHCYGRGQVSQFAAERKDGTPVCHYPRYRETLPNGVSYDVLDFGFNPRADDTPVWLVPDGKLFLMGDNRDDSADSRFDATSGGGIGLVPQDNLVGKATIMIWSTDGSSEWIKPWTWFTAARWNRIGGTF